VFGRVLDVMVFLLIEYNIQIFHYDISSKPVLMSTSITDIEIEKKSSYLTLFREAFNSLKKQNQFNLNPSTPDSKTGHLCHGIRQKKHFFLLSKTVINDKFEPFCLINIFKANVFSKKKIFN
jgi:hypothetical protein